MYLKDTIAAIATPVGRGGVGIIKISGPDALQIVTSLFRSPAGDVRSPRTHHLCYGTIIDPHDASVLDEVLLSYMQGPASYTREDVVEINCHSGFTVLQKILELVIRGGARPAEPGEFTKRAFLNGRIDLAQAEAVMDIIEAKTEASLKIATRQLQGRLSEKLHALQDGILDLISHIEASIDFPEEDLDVRSSQACERNLAEISSDISALIATYYEGKLYRLGVRTIIVGKPNVGKSSILNALLGETRALVTPIPGTTRDFIQESISIRGIPIVIQDTAGLHDGSGEIEQLAMELTRAKLSDAELLLFVIDGSQQLDDRDRSILEEIKSRPVITIINKSDLPQRFSLEEAYRVLPFDRIALVSALYGRGIEQLQDLIYRTVLQSAPLTASDILITNVRQKSALETTLDSLQAAQNGLRSNLSPELIALDFQSALQAIGEITGKASTEDILDRIFSAFCVGK